MTTVIAQQWMSVDGYAAGPGGEGDLFDTVPPAAEAASQQANALLVDQIDEVLLGRTTYASYVQFWPASDEPIAPRVNAVSKTVCSTTLSDAPWGDHAPARVVRDAVAHVRGRRADAAAAGPTLLVWGSLSVQQALLAAGELDQLDLFVAPVALGAGRPLLDPGTRVSLEQLAVEDLGGASRVRYRVLDDPGRDR